MKKIAILMFILCFLALNACEMPGSEVAEKDVLKQVQNDESMNINAMHVISDGEYEYELEIKPTSKLFDQRLIKINVETGEDEIVFDSVRDAVEEVGATDPPQILKIFAEPEGVDFIIYKTYMPDTDNPAGELIRFDKNTEKLELMNANEIYDGFFGGMALSGDQTKFVWIPNEENEAASEMYLIDLLEDEHELVVELEGDETFNAGGYAMSTHFEVEIVDNQFVRYSVYDQSKKGADFDAFDEDERAGIYLRTETVEF